MLRACLPAALRRPRVRPPCSSPPEAVGPGCGRHLSRARRAAPHGPAPGPRRRRRRPRPHPTSASAPRHVRSASGPTHIRYSGAVELELVSQGVRLSADVVDYYLDRHHLTATGNVVFVTPPAACRPTAPRSTPRSSTGTFHHAFGSASVSDRVDRSFFGAQEPDAFFYGETIEKLGRRSLPDPQGRLHHLRPADAALGDDRRLGHAHARQARGADQRGARRSRTCRCSTCRRCTTRSTRRTARPASCCRSTARRWSAATRSATPSSGPIDRSQDLTLHARLVQRRPVRATAASTATSRRRASSGQLRVYRLDERGHHLPAERRRRRPARRRTASICAADRAGAAGRLPGPRQRRLHHRPGGAAALPAGHVQRDLADAQLPGQRVGRARPRQPISATYGISEVFCGTTTRGRWAAGRASSSRAR